MSDGKINAAEIIGEIYDYIENNVFKDVTNLSRNLKVMKYNTDHDWYNCSIISKYISNKDESEVRVYSISRWRQIFGEQMSILVPRENPRILLLRPDFDEENSLCFKSVEFYYLSSLSKNENYKYLCKSQAEVAMEGYHLKEKSSVMKKGWQERLLDDYLNKFTFYKKAHDMTKVFYRNAMLYTFGSNLLIETQSVALKCPDNIKNKIVLYRNMHQLIVNFHIAFKVFLAKLNEEHREMKDKGLVEDRPFRNGYERLRELERGI